MNKTGIFLLIVLSILLSGCQTSDESRFLSLAEKSPDIDTKIDYYLHGLEEYPENIKYIYNSAYFLTLDKQYDKAIEILKSGIKEEEKAINLYLLLSYIYRENYMLSSYENTLLTLIKTDPGYVDAKLRLLEFYMTYGYKNKALSLAKEMYTYLYDNQIVLKALAFYESEFYMQFLDDKGNDDKEIKKNNLYPPTIPRLDIELENNLKLVRSNPSLFEFSQDHHIFD